MAWRFALRQCAAKDVKVNRFFIEESWSLPHRKAMPAMRSLSQ